MEHIGGNLSKSGKINGTLDRISEDREEISESIPSIKSHQYHLRLLYEADKAISDVLFRLCWSSWWEWDVGSALYFWRWGENKVLARDVMIPFISSDLPRNVKRGRSLEKS